MMTYQLGSSKKERERLEIQAQLYNDEQYIQLEKNFNVCEFGCGNGANLWIAQQLKQGQYIGLDIQKNQIEKAQKKSISMQLNNSTFYHTDGSEIPVTTDWADLSFCRLVLVHNPKPLELLNEMVRVTKSNGKVLVIEPNNLSYIAYNKPYLNKCYHARVRYMYRPDKGTLDICPQLYHLFKQAGVFHITIKQHPIYCDSRQPEMLKQFYRNWVKMLDAVKEQLFANNLISINDYEAAAQEAEIINDGDSIYQSLWIAEGSVNESK